MQLEGTPGQRLGVYVTEPGTPDYDAMILLDMTGPPPPRKAGRPTTALTGPPSPARAPRRRREVNW
ncbi:MAG: hypothetical protein ACLP52_09010 [Streptosporangiaceae bacterium]